jgi:hypothetical protein
MTDTVKEFLISLGWASNQTGQKQFEAAIESATLKARLLGDGLEELARKVLDSVSNVATNFDRLYFQAQRTNTAAATVSDFVKVMAQAGVSAGEAAGSIESMAAKLRAGSIAVQDINRMGFGLNPITGQMELQQKYLKNLSHMSTALLIQGAHQVGMSDNVAMALRRNADDILEQMDKLAAYRKTLGFDLPQAEIDANKLATIWRDTHNKITAISDDIGSGLTKALIGPLNAFDQFLTANSKGIGADIDIISKALLAMTTAWVGDFQKIMNDPQSFDSFRDGMRDFAVSIKELADNFHGFIKDIQLLLSYGDKFADILNRLSGNKSDLDSYNRGGAAIEGALGAGGQANADGSAPTGVWGAAKNFYRRHAPGWAGGGPPAAGGGAEAAPGGGASASPLRGAPAAAATGPTGVPYDATSMTTGTGFSAEQYGAFKEGLTDIEGKRYDRMGGAGGRFAGRYQMGPAEITETAARLGVPRPSTAEFLADPAMQERFFENYTLDHYNQLMRNPKFAAMSKPQQLQMLGYAHNQGVGGANRYLNTGAAGTDAWGTSGTAYFGPIGRRLGALDEPAQHAPAGEPARAPAVSNLPNPWKGMGNWEPQGALTGSLMGGQTPTLGGAAGTAGTTIHAPMDTKIMIDGLSSEANPSPHMVAAGITQQPADLTRNLQGATF